MVTIIQSVFLACKAVLQNWVYRSLFLLLIPLIAFLLFLIPVTYIPGNSISFQATLFTISDYLLIIPLAGLESLLLVMFVYLMRHSRKQTLPRMSPGGFGLVSGVPAFLFGTKLCPICMASIFGLFGPGVVAFALQYRTGIFLGSMILLLVSVYTVSLQINGVCSKCLYSGVTGSTRGNVKQASYGKKG